MKRKPIGVTMGSNGLPTLALHRQAFATHYDRSNVFHGPLLNTRR
jgi:hypothetical protein